MDCGKRIGFVCIDSIAICNYAVVFRILLSIRKSHNIPTYPTFFFILLPQHQPQNYDQAVEDYKARHPEEERMMMSADEKLEEAIADAMKRQKAENEEALRRMEAKAAINSEFILEMSEDSITAGDWA